MVTNKRLLVLLSFLILFLPIVNAVKPLVTSSAGVAGFEIEFPQTEFLKVGTDVTLHFHVFNTSNGVAILNDTAECHFHLYKPGGGHIYKAENLRNIYDTFDWEVPINGTNFTETGQYSYIFQCNSSSQGGFVGVPFLVTQSGFDNVPDGATSGVAITMFLLVLIIGLYTLAYVIGDPTGNIVTDFIIKRSIMLIATFLLLLSTAMMSSISLAGSLGINKELFTLLWVIGIFCWVFMIWLVFGTLVQTMKLSAKIVSGKRMGDDDDL